MTRIAAPHDGYALALEEARRAIEDQERAVIELRARASGLLGAATITTSFLGGQALGRHEIGGAAWVAIACVVGVGVCALGVLWPGRDWKLLIGPREFIAMFLESGEGPPPMLHTIQRDLALHLGDGVERNRRRLFVSTMLVRVGAILLVLEAAAWVVALVSMSS